MVTLSTGQSIHDVRNHQLKALLTQSVLNPHETSHLQFTEGTVSIRKNPNGLFEIVSSSFTIDPVTLSRITHLFNHIRSSSSPEQTTVTNRTLSINGGQVSYTYGDITVTDDNTNSTVKRVAKLGETVTSQTSNPVERTPSETPQAYTLKRQIESDLDSKKIQAIEDPVTRCPPGIVFDGDSVDMYFGPRPKLATGSILATTSTLTGVVDQVRESLEYSLFGTLTVQYFSDTNERFFVTITTNPNTFKFEIKEQHLPTLQASQIKNLL